MAVDLARIRLLVTDIDGVLTDGTVLVWTQADSLHRMVGPDVMQACRYSKRDGVLLPAMREAGIEVVALTSERDDIGHAKRCAKLGIPLHTCTPLDKLAALRTIAEEAHGIPLSEVAYIGDDLPDLPCLEAVAEAGGAAFVPMGSPAAGLCSYEGDQLVTRGRRIVARHMTEGGTGTLREVCALLLTARGYDCNAWPVVKR